MKGLIIPIIILPTLHMYAGNDEIITSTEESSSAGKMQFLVSIPSTPVKDQFKTSTCWSFSGISLIETELIRMNKGEFDLSEMFVIHHNYERKADRYVRMHGKINFAPGGEANDVTDVFQEFGIVPDEIYSGLKVNTGQHMHGEMDRVLEKYIDAVVTNPEKEISPVWQEGFGRVLDSYLGEIPERFKFNDQEYTPGSFAESLNLSTVKFVMITSFMKYPYYEPVILEIPDNWSWAESYNVPIEILEQIVDTALYHGYSIAWASDISESGFNFKKGLALVPDIQYAPESARESNKWKKKSEEEKENIIFSLSEPIEELNVTPEIRQEAFDNYTTTDDHGMQILGIAEDKNNRCFYYVKNSWGQDNPYNGFIYVSKPYFRFKTISIMLNIEALTPEMRLKLKL
jgi:bleomycin hydrolase